MYTIQYTSFPKNPQIYGLQNIPNFLWGLYVLKLVRNFEPNVACAFLWGGVEMFSEITTFDPLSVAIGCSGGIPHQNSSVFTYFVLAYG